MFESPPLGHIVARGHRAVATSWGGNLGVGQREKLWREFFSDPLQWCDCTSEKVNVRYPDFKHKKTHGALWLGDRQNPPWVEAKLAALAPRTLELDSFSWNRKLARHVKAGQYEKTIQFFREMQQKRMSLDRFTFVPVLNACASLQALDEGLRAHQHIIQCGWEAHVFVGSCLVDMYAKCESMEDAQSVFNKMPCRDVVTWTAMISGHVNVEKGTKQWNYFDKCKRKKVCNQTLSLLWER
jgi:pentatricopeptide repeat protein